ncbi:MAG: CAP domain-containing protein, partial [Betaproteobacteria bacterium]
QVLVDRVNYYRKRAGVTPVIADWRLRKSAQSHADYLSSTNSVGHLEHDTANAYYTGEDPYRRINAAGYVFAQAGELVAKTPSRDVAGAVDRLMDAVYHRFVILSSDLTQAGAAAGRKTMRDDEMTEVTIDFAAPVTPIARDSTLIVYPAREQAGIRAAFDATTEIPNPMPGRTVVGSPISVQADSGLELTVDVFRISAMNASTSDGFLRSRLLVHGDDADTPPWAAALIPERPLLLRTAYRVEFSGKIDGNAVAQTWTFTTAAQ